MNAAGPLDGQIVRIDRPCQRCGSLHAAIADVPCGPHIAALRCTGCGRFLKWMSGATREFLVKLAAEFGGLESIRHFESANPPLRSTGPRIPPSSAF